MKWTDIPSGSLRAAEQRLWLALGENADTVIDRINTEPAFATYIASMMVKKDDLMNLPTSIDRARVIMGRNYFGVKELYDCFGLHGYHETWHRVPFSEETLWLCKDSHILVAYSDHTIDDIYSRHPNLFVHYSGGGLGSYGSEPLMNERGKRSWYLLRKTAIKESRNITWDKQVQLISEYEEVPPAQLVVFSMIGHFLTTGEKLYLGTDIVCSSFWSDEARVVVGAMSEDGVVVGFGRWLNGLSRSKYVGITSMVKPIKM